MADVKWIKITTDIFDDEKIKIIDTMPARDEILVIWFKLLSLAGKTNQSGMLFMSNRIAYTPEMLSAVFNRELNVVKLALSIFQNFGMIEIEDSEIICISNWEKHQNVDGLEKIRLQTNERVKRVREKKKQLLLNDCNATCNATVTQSNATEEELEKEKRNLKTFTSDSEEYRLSKLLFNLMRNNNPTCKEPNIQSWCKDIDLMIRNDNRTCDQIEAVIKFCQSDSFWKSNVLSTSKLREKFDTLTLRMNENKVNYKSTNNVTIADF
jgi:predicted phage replisome organizer